MHILFVEDHADTAQLVRIVLERSGHLVSLAATVAEALTVLRNTPIDLLLSDLGLPDGDGCDLMRTSAAERQVPGIALTGYVQAGDIKAAIAAGFVQVLAKPIAFEVLLAAIERIRLAARPTV